MVVVALGGGAVVVVVVGQNEGVQTVVVVVGAVVVVVVGGSVVVVVGQIPVVHTVVGVVAFGAAAAWVATEARAARAAAPISAATAAPAQPRHLLPLTSPSSPGARRLDRSPAPSESSRRPSGRAGAYDLFVGAGASTGQVVGQRDGELVEAVRAGDTAAFSELYRAHAGAVHRVAAAMLNDPAAAGDVVQEAFVRALEQISSLRDPERFRPWLLSIARHCAVDFLRQRQRAGSLADVDAEHLRDQAGGPDAVAELSELAGLLKRSMVALSTRDATAVFLVSQLGYAPAEVAKVLGVSVGAAKVVVHRARRRLRDALMMEVLVRRQAGGCAVLQDRVEAGDAAGAGRHLRACGECAAAAKDELQLFDAGGSRAHGPPPTC